MQITRPFELINQATDYDVRCNVSGGGPKAKQEQWFMDFKALVMFTNL